MRTDIKRTTMNITTYCNLRCKHCLAFIPYYKDPSHVSAEEARKVLQTYFRVVDSVEHFTITGGEPLLNKDAYDIINEVFQYEGQITGSVDFVTNSTIEIPENILNLFETHRDHAKIVLSDYGPELSTKIDVIREKLEDRNINYRVSKFYGDDLYYDGWIDFSDQSLKWKTGEEREKNAQKCIQRIGKYFAIYDGELHSCSRSFWRIKQNIIPKIKGEYVDLLAEDTSIEEKRVDLMKMYEMKSSTSCAYCVGLCNGIPRVKPAQQLPREYSGITGQRI